MQDKRLLTIKEAAAYVGLGINNARDLMDIINATRHLSERRILFDKQVIDQWLDDEIQKAAANQAN